MSPYLAPYFFREQSFFFFLFSLSLCLIENIAVDLKNSESITKDFTEKPLASSSEHISVDRSKTDHCIKAVMSNAIERTGKKPQGYQAPASLDFPVLPLDDLTSFAFYYK